jgi:hypothetical protein
MDMGQIMQAAQGGDPQAAAFLQQLLAGGAGRGGGGGLLEAIKPQPAPSFGPMPEAPEGGPLAAFDKAQELMGGMMGEAATTAPIQGSGAGAATTTPSGITPAMTPPTPAQVAPQAADPSQQGGGGLLGLIARMLGQGG